MKIAFVIYSLEAAGAERVTALLANYFSERTESVVVVTFASRESDFYALHSGVQRLALDPWPVKKPGPKSIVSKLLRPILLRKCLRRMEPDVVIGEMTTTNVLVAMASTRTHPWLLIGTEHLYPPSLPLPFYWKLLRKFFYRRLDLLIAPTVATAIWLQEKLSLSNVYSIPNPVIVDIDKAATTAIPLGFPVGKNVVLGVGRLEHEKGFDLLISAFAKASQCEPDWCLVILGDGRERERLATRAKGLGLTNSVILPGRVKNIDCWYACSEIFAFSSRCEGFGNALAEALAYGLPAVSFDCDVGPREILRDGIDGYLVPPGDVEAFAERLLVLMKDEKLRRQMADAARAGGERFALARVGGEWSRLIEEGLEAVSRSQQRGCGVK